MHPFVILLERYRRRAGLGMNALARASWLSPSYVSRLADGGRRPPSRSIVQGLARGLGLDPVDADRLLVIAGYAPDWMVAAAEVARIEPRLVRHAG